MAAVAAAERHFLQRGCLKFGLEHSGFFFGGFQLAVL